MKEGRKAIIRNAVLFATIFSGLLYGLWRLATDDLPSIPRQPWNDARESQ